MPTNRKHRIVIDSNIWISFLLTSDYSKLDRLFVADSATLLFSQELIDEFVEVARRPKFRKYFSLEDLEDLLIRLRTIAEFIPVISHVDLCRDPKDNFLLSLAKDGRASHLLTGDNDLLVLKKVGKTKILTITEYLHAIG
jgi:putative PIN family toxin of toxin-antitoxin system